MKLVKNTILLISAFVYGVSCQMMETVQYDENVKILVSVSEDEYTRVSEDGSRFVDGDEIQVVNKSRSTNNNATFTYDMSADDWSTDDVILWEGQGDNEFEAWHPASASFESFTISGDQSAGLGLSDWMTAYAVAKPSDGGVALSFRRHLAKVNVKITSWGSEYPTGSQTVNGLYIRSLSEVMHNYGLYITGNGSPVSIKTYVLDANEEFVAIVSPGTYSAGSEIMSIYVNGNSEPLSVKTSKSLELKSGMAYSFELTVGRDCIEIAPGDVSVTDWDEEEMENQEIMADVVDSEEIIEFNEDHCIYYRQNLTGGWDNGYNNYSDVVSYINCSSDGSVVEMKFKLNSWNNNNDYYLAAGSNRAKDSCDEFGFNNTSLWLAWNISEDEGYSYRWKWTEIGVSPTELINLRFSGNDETLIINDKILACTGIKSMSWTYLFSSYFREYDEGEWKTYDGVPDGSALYYVKMYDVNGQLTYLGYAAKAINPSTSKLEYCWCSNKKGDIQYHFANDSANQGGYTGNF